MSEAVNMLSGKRPAEFTHDAQMSKDGTAALEESTSRMGTMMMTIGRGRKVAK